MNDDLISKFNELKSKHAELTTEKLKYEAKREQLNADIKAIQDKYSQYDLSTIESVENIINNLTKQLELELNNINEQYLKIKAI
jgi:phage regulator Rha-like protein